MQMGLHEVQVESHRKKDGAFLIIISRSAILYQVGDWTPMISPEMGS